MNLAFKKSINLSLILLFAGSTFLSAQYTKTIFLSGTGFDKTVEWEFFCSDGMKSGSWTSIEVPSCWEQEGFGQYNYGHDAFEERLRRRAITGISLTWKRAGKVSPSILSSME